MPLLRHTPFRRKKVPRNLGDDTPLYYLEVTGEVFTEYEEYCYRTIQCNSLVWTCAETGRTDLTFAEALESERDAKQILACFPEELKLPALYLASIAQCPDFQELVSDVYNFMEEHYFVNELVVPTIKCKWKLGKILKVNNPQGANLQSSKKSLKKLQHYTPPGWYEYELSTNVDGKVIESKCIGSKLKRPDDSCLTKDTLSAFLKQNAVLDARGIWVIKGSVLQQYNIQFVKFEDIFCGDPPVFTGSRKTSKVSNSDKGTFGQRREKSAFDDQVKQTGQQNIEKYFVSKMASPVRSDQDNSESDDDIVNEDIKSETASVCEVSSEEESGSSGDEIKVVWASSVKPNKRAMSKLYKKMGKVDLEEDTITTKQGLGITPDHPSLEETEKVRSPKKDSPRKLHSSVDDLEAKQKGTISPTKKLKQTRMFGSPTSSSSVENKKSFAVPYKKGHKNSIHGRRKQKVVGTLKPWVQKTQKEKGFPVGASSSVVKAHTSSPTQTLKEKKKNWLEVQREIEQREKERKQEERQRKKAKLEEEKLKFAKFMKEWRKHREDLLCEDLKPLPVLSEVNCRIPNELFGDFMMILEFLHSFNSVFKVKITGGITFEFLEKALVETEIAGPLNDIIKVLLTTIFELQVIEHEKPRSGVPIAGDLNFDDSYNEDTTQEAISQSLTATGWCDVFQDVSLHDIPITSTSVSEILRLHLLGSGGRAWDTMSKCLSYRGGCINLDDPGLWLRVEKPSILLNLSQNHISDLSIAEKLEILCCLVNQILTYATVRDKVEERCEQARQARASVRALQVAEIKLQKEATAKRIQEKKDAKLLLAKGSPQVSSDYAVSEKQRIEKEMSKLKVELQKKSTKVLPLAMSGQLLPLGCDRAHRKYWLFSSLPGLFVEYNPYEIGPCLPQPTPRPLELSDTLTHVRKLFEEEGHNSSDKENDSSDRDVSKPPSVSVKKMLGEQNNSVETLSSNRPNEKEDPVTDAVNEGELLLCTASDSCPVHCPRVLRSHWYFFTKRDDVTALLESLNDRGIRESALLRILKQEEQRIVECVSQCPVHKLNPEKFQFVEGEQRKSTRQHPGHKYDSIKSNFPPGTPISYIMEWTMREYILELENRITIGGVGSLKVDNRMAWRKAIENGHYDKQCEKLVWGFRIRNKIEGKQDRENAEEEEEKVESCEQGEYEKIESSEQGEDEKVESSEEGEDEKFESSEQGDEKIGSCEQGEDEKVESSEQGEDEKIEPSEQGEDEKVEFSEEGADKGKVETSEKGVGEEKVESSGEDKVNDQMKTKESEQNVRGEERCDDDPSDVQSSDESAIIVYDGPSTGQIPRKSVAKEEKRSGSEEEDKKSILKQDCDIFERIDQQDPEDDCYLDEGSSSSEENENKSLDKHESSNRISTLTSVPPPRNPVIKDLASAILQVEQSLDPRCLKKPLADENGKMKSRLKHWEVSLMNTINFSQLFIHHSTLENSINWSSSIYNSPCFVCDSRKYGKKMILCDGCNKRFHIFCVKPKLKSMPEGRWQCHYCAPEESESSEDSANDSNMPTRSSTGRKRKAESDNDDCSESEHHSKIRRTNEHDTCKKCAQTGELVYCLTCSVGYHLECTNSSRMMRQQKENWMCGSCKNETQMSLSDDEIQSEDEAIESVPDEPRGNNHTVSCDESWTETSSSEESRDENTMYPVRKRPGKSISQTPDIQTYLENDDMLSSPSRERRGCASAARAKIASFTKRLRSNSWDDDDASQANTAEASMSSYNIQDGASIRRSSRRSLFASDDLPLDNAILQDLLTEMLQHEYAWPFVRPVRKSQVPDYHTKIKIPMDLGTIKYKLNTAEYKTNRDFIKDILLVFENCFMYNHQNTIEYHCGKILLLFFEQRSRELGLNWKNETTVE